MNADPTSHQTELLPGLFWYHQYVTGEHWREVRQKAIAHAQRRCQECGATDVQLEVCHRALDHIGAERTADLVVLCDKCRASKERLRWLPALPYIEHENELLPEKAKSPALDARLQTQTSEISQPATKPLPIYRKASSSAVVVTMATAIWVVGGIGLAIAQLPAAKLTVEVGLVCFYFMGSLLLAALAIRQRSLQGRPAAESVLQLGILSLLPGFSLIPLWLAAQWTAERHRGWIVGFLLVGTAAFASTLLIPRQEIPAGIVGPSATVMATAQTTIVPTNSSPASTAVPAITPSVESPVTQAPTAVASQAPTCRVATSITLADVGQTMCVTGQVLQTRLDNETFYVVFGKQRGDFYMVSYGGPISGVVAKACVTGSGKIQQLASSPIMVVRGLTLCN